MLYFKIIHLGFESKRKTVVNIKIKKMHLLLSSHGFASDVGLTG